MGATHFIDGAAVRRGNNMASGRDGWAGASSYEDFMGRWSRQLAPRFVSWLQIPQGAHWLDVGCGTGALTDAICRHANPASVSGCDPAKPFIDYAKARSKDPRVSYVAAGVGDLPGRADGYDSVTSMLALNFFPDPKAAVEEMRSLLATEGTVSACVWDYGGRMEFLRYFWDAVTAVDPAAEALDEGKRFPLCQPDALADLFRSCRLADVRCEAIDIPTVFAGLDDYWKPMLGGTGPAPSYVASLDEDQASRLKKRLNAELPRGTGGQIMLTARAWAVRGTA